MDTVYKTHQQLRLIYITVYTHTSTCVCVFVRDRIYDDALYCAKDDFLVELKIYGKCLYTFHAFFHINEFLNTLPCFLF